MPPALVSRDTTVTDTLGKVGVNDAGRARREKIENAVLRYLRRHPNASDTVSGICDWWLPAEGIEASPQLVEAVLDELVAQQRVQRHELSDGTRIYASREDERRGA
jgi:hypothetical protein